MRVVIVGAGGISYQHAAACRDLPDVELVAICDTRLEAAAKLADEFGVANRYEGVDALLGAESADLAIVSAWGRAHAELVEKLARSGRVKGILCEKPLAIDAPEAAEMARVAEATGVLLAEAFRLRHQPIHHRAIELLRAGRIGDVRHVRNAMMTHQPPERRRPELNWRFNKPAGGGVTYDIGCYCINQARWAIGAEPETVHAVGRWGEVSQVDEHVVAHATFPGGRTAEWCVSWQAGPAHVAEVLGTAGRMRIERAWGIDAQGATAIEITEPDGKVETIEFAPVKQFELQLAHMKECLETGRPHRIPPSDSIAQMRVIDAVYASLRTGQAAELPSAVAR
jgi:xylose dehydrogenase (NAD/NADP)